MAKKTANHSYIPKRDMTEYPMEVQKTQRGPELFDACLEQGLADGLSEDAAIFYILHNWQAMVAMMNPGTKMDGPVTPQQ